MKVRDCPKKQKTLVQETNLFFHGSLEVFQRIGGKMPFDKNGPTKIGVRASAIETKKNIFTPNDSKIVPQVLNMGTKFGMR